MAVQAGLCGTWSETKVWFSHAKTHISKAIVLVQPTSGGFSMNSVVLMVVLISPGLFTMDVHVAHLFTLEPRREKTGLREFRPCATQIGPYSHRSRLEA